MKSSPEITAKVARLHALLVEIGRLRSLRDPMADLALKLSSPQLHALMWLGEDGPLPMSVLARRIGSPVPACTGIVDRLQRMGLVERERQEHDRRVVLVALTAEGRALFTQGRAVLEEQLTMTLSLLSTDDQDALLAIIGRLVEALMKRASEAQAEPTE